jgi:hypothetical protein
MRSSRDAEIIDLWIENSEVRTPAPAIVLISNDCQHRSKGPETVPNLTSAAVCD